MPKDGAARAALPLLIILLLLVLVSACGDDTSDDDLTLTVPPSPDASTDVSPTPQPEPTSTEVESALVAVEDDPTPTPTSDLTATSTPSPTPMPSTATPTTAPSTATSEPTSTPSPPPTATPVPTETSPPTAEMNQPVSSVAEGEVVIIDLDYNPEVGEDKDGELTFIQNLSSQPVELEGWTLFDIADHVFIFPSYILQPSATVTVHVCTGEPAPDIIYWGHCKAVWNNDGDTITLADAAGNVISVYSY